MAQVSIIGANIGADAERRQAGDTDVVSFRCCDNMKRGGKDFSTWYTVNVWGNYGTALERDLVKGARVSVHGEVINREYTDRDGNKKSSLDVRAASVHIERGAEGRPAAPPAPEDPDDDIPF